MIKLSDFIFKHIVEKHGISQAFLVTGGGAMHLNNSIGHTKGLSYCCPLHEQGAAMAAEGYYRASSKMAVVNITTGPGGTNTMTGVLGQWLDSIPCLYISGQIKTATMKNSYPELNLRQLGDQESDIIGMVSPITKYAVTVKNPLKIKYELDKALYIAQEGRPGPVWLDIPLDVQYANIDETELMDFVPEEIAIKYDHEQIYKQLKQLIAKIKIAKSPVIYVGNGVRLSGQMECFLSIIEKLEIPVVTAISGSDILWEEHPLYFGRPGICGNRIGNIMVQNSDLLLVIGTRLGIRQIGYNFEQWASKAYKVMVDVDEAEMNKPTLSIDLKIYDDLSHFLPALEKEVINNKFPSFENWKNWGRNISSKLPTLLDDNPNTEAYVNSYLFVQELFKQIQENDIVVTTNGTAYTCTYQAMLINRGVRVFANQGCASMGYGLPASIGAALSTKKGKIVCLENDGSIQMNLQELQTVLTYNLPIKIFVLENQGYLAMKTTQNAFFGGHLTGVGPTSGVVCPEMERIAEAYNIPYFKILNNEELVNTIKIVLNTETAVICEIKMCPSQSLFPKSTSFMDENGKMTSAPLDKMAPLMPETLQNQCIYKSE
jgi:acetolactate synthase-1/2/3 large subunit